MKPLVPLALALRLSGPALAKPANAPPAALAKDAAALAVQRHDAGGKAGRSPGMIKIADLNGDGQRDYVIDINHYNCEGAASALLNGDAGAGVTVYLGGPGNTARQAWTGTASMANQKACTRLLAWNPAKAAFALAPVSEAKIIP